MSHKPIASDPQRHLVYEWEDQFGLSAHGELNTKRFYKTLRDVCAYYGVKRPKAGTIPRAWRKQWAAVCDTENSAIWFHPQNCTARFLLHELAHWVLDMYGLGGPPHQPLWLGVFIHLMDKWLVCPEIASKASARAAGCRFVNPHDCTPEALKRRAAPSKLRQLLSQASA